MGGTWMRRMMGTAAVGLAATALCRAQDESGPHPSLLQIIRDGMEIPAYVIVAGSIITLALIVEHFIVVRRSGVVPPAQVRRAKTQIEARNFRACLDTLRKSHTFFAQVMTAALRHARHGFDAMHDAALEKSGELSGRMFRKAEYLNIIGNLSPLMGLLGTVWGMIEAFGSLAAAGGQASAGGLASGISKALVNTLLGLALAIVGIGFFGVCRNRIESLTVAATVESLDLLEYFRPSAVKPAPNQPPSEGSTGGPPAVAAGASEPAVAPPRQDAS